MTKKTSILFLSVNSTTLCRWLSSCLDWVIHIPCRWLCRHALIGSSAYHLAGYVVMPLPGSSTYHNGGYAVMPLSGHPHTMSSVMSSCLCLVIHIPCRWLCRHALVHPHTMSPVVVMLWFIHALMASPHNFSLLSSHHYSLFSLCKRGSPGHAGWCRGIFSLVHGTEPVHRRRPPVILILIAFTCAQLHSRYLNNSLPRA